ncbi:MAG: hypothetical protein IPM82_16600 [Saprospiraceae bacterium]|nr:hypothetical protein [Saprospiraceae bacterium]
MNGEHYPVEIHFVHRNPTTGQLAVVGVLVEEGDENPFFETSAISGHTTRATIPLPVPQSERVDAAGYNNSSTAHFGGTMAH